MNDSNFNNLNGGDFNGNDDDDDNASQNSDMIAKRKAKVVYDDWGNANKKIYIKYVIRIIINNI